MSDFRELANRLTASLGLTVPPVAVSLVDEVPRGVPMFEGTVAAGCVFWQKAAAGTFATETTDHELCAIGVHTHHLARPSASFGTELQDALKAMAGLDYVREAEVAAIPVINREVRYVVYGPLAEANTPPAVVLLFAHAQHGLIITEAVQRIDGGIPPAMGRPACAVVPQVVNNGRAALSLGCCGARAYLDVLSDDIALWALPGNTLGRYAKEIEILAGANRTLTVFHARRRADVAAGQRPTVQESLQHAFS